MGTTPDLSQTVADPFIEPVFLRYVAGLSMAPFAGNDTPQKIADFQLSYLSTLTHEANILAGTYNETGTRQIDTKDTAMRFHLIASETDLNLSMTLLKNSKKILSYTNQRIILDPLPKALVAKLQARLKTPEGLTLCDVIDIDIGEDIKLADCRVKSIKTLPIIADNTTIVIDNEPVSWLEMRDRMTQKITGPST